MPKKKVLRMSHDTRAVLEVLVGVRGGAYYNYASAIRGPDRMNGDGSGGSGGVCKCVTTALIRGNAAAFGVGMDSRTLQGIITDADALRAIRDMPYHCKQHLISGLMALAKYYRRVGNRMAHDLLMKMSEQFRLHEYEDYLKNFRKIQKAWRK